MILDTNALSAVADDQPAVVNLYRQAASMELPVIVPGEYRFGIGQSRRRSEYERWLRELIAATRVLEIEDETSRHYAGIRAALKKAGRLIPSNDLRIAALCRQHRCITHGQSGLHGRRESSRPDFARTIHAS